MSRVNIDREPLDSLADAIAAKSERPVPLTIPGMRDAVLGIETGIEPTGTRNINKNGVYDVTEYALADVSIYPKLTSITIDPTTSNQFIEPDAGMDGFSSVQVHAASLQEKYATPTEEYQDITPDEWELVWEETQSSASASSNTIDILLPQSVRNLYGEGVRVKGYVTPYDAGDENSVDDSVLWEVDVDNNGPKIYPSSLGMIQYVEIKTARLYVRLSQSGYSSYHFEIYSGTSYIGLSRVGINAIPGNYVGSLIPRNTADDLLVQGRTIYTASGYYATQVAKSVDEGTAGVPVANKGTVTSNHAIIITPSVTNTTGYIYGSTKTGSPVAVTASELVSGTKTITENGTGIDVVNYASVDVAVPAPSLQTKTATPTESTQSISPDSGYDGLSSVTINPIPSNYGRITWDGSVLTVS